MKKIGIVGSRRRHALRDYQALEREFDKIYQPGDWIVSGGCREGADNYAESLAKDRGITIIIHYPRKEDLDQKLLADNPRAAYSIINHERNTRIAQDCDVLIALVADDREGGTEDTIKKTANLGKMTHAILSDGIVVDETVMGFQV